MFPFFLSSSDDGTVNVWKIETTNKNVILEITFQVGWKDHSSFITDVIVLHESMIVSVGLDGIVNIREWVKGNNLDSKTTFKEWSLNLQIQSIAISPCEKNVYLLLQGASTF